MLVATRRLLTCPEKLNVIRRYPSPPRIQNMNDRSKEKATALTVIGLLVGLSLVSLAVALSLRKKGSGTNSSVALNTDQYLPKESSMVPPGDKPFSNPHLRAMKEDKETRYSLNFEFVRRHPWWNKRPTKEELAAAIGKAISLGRGTVIWVNRDGTFAFQTREECPDPVNATYPGRNDLLRSQYFFAQLDEFGDSQKLDVIIYLLHWIEFAGRMTDQN